MIIEDVDLVIIFYSPTVCGHSFVDFHFRGDSHSWGRDGAEAEKENLVVQDSECEVPASERVLL